MSGLYSIFGDTVTAALDILDRNKLTVYEGEMSERRCGVVVGSSGLTHVLLLSGQYCSCPSYQYSALRDPGQIYCKHLLAAQLGLALGCVVTSSVEDCHVNSLLQDLA